MFFMILFSYQIYIPSCSGSLVIAIKYEAEYIPYIAMILFPILQINDHIKSCIFCRVFI